MSVLKSQRELCVYKFEDRCKNSNIEIIFIEGIKLPYIYTKFQFFEVVLVLNVLIAYFREKRA